MVKPLSHDMNMHLIQESLYAALQYFLYGSLSAMSFRTWLAHRHQLHTNHLSSLFTAIKELGSDKAKSLVIPEGYFINHSQYAQILADVYKIWEDNLPESILEEKTLELGMPYKDWLSNGGSANKYLPVHSLKLSIDKYGSEFFSRALLHGSVGSLDDTQGFSDMDLAFVVKSSVLTNSKKLLKLRKIAEQYLILSYSFDPYMHHGPYYISELDINWYAEAQFPSILFSYGVDLLDGSQERKMGIRNSDEVTDNMLRMFEEFFKNLASKPFQVSNSYDVEWVLGSVMLLPALYLQRTTGEYRYKRDTFQLAEKYFSAEVWEPVVLATELRTTLGQRPKPSRFLIWLANRLGWPNLVRIWALRHPSNLVRAKQANEILGLDYPNRVLRLLSVMTNKLDI